MVFGQSACPRKREGPTAPPTLPLLEFETSARGPPCNPFRVEPRVGGGIFGNVEEMKKLDFDNLSQNHLAAHLPKNECQARPACNGR